LDDGSYDALVIDAEAGGDGTVLLSITIVAGALKGELVSVRATGLGRDPLDLLAMPCALVVQAGAPRVVFD
jgi:hypothetical protein